MVLSVDEELIYEGNGNGSILESAQRETHGPLLFNPIYSCS